MRGVGFWAVVSLVVLTAMVTLSASALAAVSYSWNIPANVRVVQKNGPYDARTFPDIQSAVNDCANNGATATNRFLVKVMPGTYDLGSATLVMKDGVDVEGSGIDNTVITSTNYTMVSVPANCSITISKLAVKFPLTFQNITAIIAQTGSNLRVIECKFFTDPNTSGNSMAVYSHGSSFFMDNTVVDLTSTNTDVYPVAIDCPAVIKNSEISGKAGGNIDAFNNAGTGMVREFINCKISATSTTNGRTHGIWGGADYEIRNTTITATSTNQDTAALVTGTATINGSIISGGINKTGGTLQIGNSQIVGSNNAVPGIDKIVNCYDGAFNPIPDL